MQISTYMNQLILKAIEIAGGANKLAKLVGVSYQTVLNWKNERFMPSHIHCMHIEKATKGKVKAIDILPNYPWSDLNGHTA